ncbi:MAG: glycosyltransferase family 2 protein [Patescibacteria group bacterium]
MNINKKHLSIGIVTPVRNEEDTLQNLANCILSQTELPDHWLIVDDASSDTTPSIINSLKRQYSWITSINLPDRGHYSRGEGSYSTAAKGFKYMLGSFDVQVLGIFDADISFEKTTIERIRDEFLRSNKLGIYGGEIIELINSKWIIPMILPKDFVRGACKFFRRQCYENIGGIKLGKSSNVISNMEALMYGWEVKRDSTLLIKHLRSGGSRDNYVQRYTKGGVEAAYIGSDPLLTLVRGARKMIKSKPYFLGGLIFLGTYFNNTVLHKDQYPNSELLKFIQKRHRQILLEGFYKW